MPLINKLVMLLGLVLSINGLSSLSEAKENLTDSGDGFIYHGFKDAAANFNFDDTISNITSNGLLRLTKNYTYPIGHAFYSRPLRFKNTIQNSSSTVSSFKGNNTSTGGSAFSFSTSFIFSVTPESPGVPGQGFAFVIAPQPRFPGTRASTDLGLFNSTNNGQPANHVVAVELGTSSNTDFDDIEGVHVGIHINDIIGIYRNLSLLDGDPIQVWIEYDGVKKKLDLTFAPVLANKPDIPITVLKPLTPLLSYDRDLSNIILDSMYIGFSSESKSPITSHYILGWSFKINGIVPPFDLSQLPEFPRIARVPTHRKTKLFGVELPIIIPVVILMNIIVILFVVRQIRNAKFADVVEDWEHTYGRLRFSYKDLYIATKGFKEKELLGTGGFGRVYKGVLPTIKTKIAVKRISHNSKQGIREFISEIISIGHLRHRNLAHLLGYCRRDGELLLVYDYMPNGSLDKLIFRKSKSNSASPILGWNRRFQIIKGVASGLIYLHEEWEQVVIHRDIKASNVLLDGKMNARLGDFGLARLYNRGTNPETTNVAGTLGYIAPEMIRSGKATTSSDVYAFGALLLEVACGRRPTELHKSESEEGEILVEWVLNCWRRGAILETSDPNLGNKFVKEEMELVLKLGLLCSHNDAKARPSMRQVMQYLNGDLVLSQTELWELDPDEFTTANTSDHRSCIENVSLSSVADSLLSGPR
ncbi:hypothetical protein MKX01_036850 [Papaver californicum]|nr:hypothetical protein MKX01_036850 [Papaver californicum]